MNLLIVLPISAKSLVNNLIDEGIAEDFTVNGTMKMANILLKLLLKNKRRN